MKYSELKKLLKKNGCYFEHDGKNHEIWHSPKTDNSFSVGRHNSQDVPTGTYKAILKQAGIE